MRPASRTCAAASPTSAKYRRSSDTVPRRRWTRSSTASSSTSSPTGADVAHWEFEPGHSAAAFAVRHMMVTWVRGSFKDVHGTLEFDPQNPAASSVHAVIDTRKLWTGEPARDEHLK